MSLLQEKCTELTDAVSRERELRSGDPEQAIRNAEYLKNVVFKYMCSMDRNEQTTLLPAVAQMLKFSAAEKAEIEARLARGPLRRVGGAVGGFLGLGR